MKHLAMVLLVGLVAVGVLVAAAEKSVKIEVSAMHCDKCVAKVEKALKGIDGVKDVSVSLKKKTAEVVLTENSTVATEQLLQAIADAGFSAKSGKIAVDAKKGDKKEECKMKEGCYEEGKNSKECPSKNMKKSSE
jgi:copper chaperone CopZ